MQLPSAPASCLVVSNTDDASISISALSGFWLSTFLPHFPNAPFALTHFSTLQLLLRVRYYWDSDSCLRSPRRQVSPLATCHFPIVPSFNHVVRHSIALSATTACCVNSRLRHFSAGSPQYPAETGSSSYGPTVRFRLLPTPPRDDAVTFSYGAVANSDRDFHPANGTPSRAYTKPLAR